MLRPYGVFYVIIIHHESALISLKMAIFTVGHTEYRMETWHWSLDRWDNRIDTWHMTGPDPQNTG